MGVYKRYEQVPEQHRFDSYAESYEGRDVWETFCRTDEYQQGSSDSFRDEVDRIGDLWCTHMDARGRHHALARPADFEAWCADLVDGRALSTAFNYWVRIKRFYDWLRWHTEHPHRYDPVLMAAAGGGAAGEIWEQMRRKWRGVRAEADDD